MLPKAMAGPRGGARQPALCKREKEGLGSFLS